VIDEARANEQAMIDDIVGRLNAGCARTDEGHEILHCQTHDHY
jgi:hypothetical protein